MRHWTESKHHKGHTWQAKVYFHSSLLEILWLVINILAIRHVSMRFFSYRWICALLTQQMTLEIDNFYVKIKLVTSLSFWLVCIFTCSLCRVFCKWMIDSFWLCFVKFDDGWLRNRLEARHGIQPTLTRLKETIACF